MIWGPMNIYIKYVFHLNCRATGSRCLRAKSLWTSRATFPLCFPEAKAAQGPFIWYPWCSNSLATTFMVSCTFLNEASWVLGQRFWGNSVPKLIYQRVTKKHNTVHWLIWNKIPPTLHPSACSYTAGMSLMIRRSWPPRIWKWTFGTEISQIRRHLRGLQRWATTFFIGKTTYQQGHTSIVNIVLLCNY